MKMKTRRIHQKNPKKVHCIIKTFVDEATRKQRELIDEQIRLQNQKLKESKEKAKETAAATAEKIPEITVNILDIKAESQAASLDDL